MSENEAIETIENAVHAMLEAFDVDAPPVPVDTMLQDPHEGLWEEVNVAEMSATFLSLHDRYSPRMSVVRLLARHVIRSAWGVEHGLEVVRTDVEYLHRFARAIVIPRQLFEEAGIDPSDIGEISDCFEVPESDEMV